MEFFHTRASKQRQGGQRTPEEMASFKGVLRHPLVNSKSVLSIQEYDPRNNNQTPGEHKGRHHCPENIPRCQHEHIFEERFWRSPEGNRREAYQNESR